MTIDNSTQLKNEGRIGTQILELLFDWYILTNDFLHRFGTNEFENLKTSKVISLLGNDIILKIWKLSDTRKDVLSFKNVERFCTPVMAERAKQEPIAKEIDRFLLLADDLETYRHTVIAHNGAKNQTITDVAADISDIIACMVDLWDALKGEKNLFIFEGVDLLAYFRGK